MNCDFLKSILNVSSSDNGKSVKEDKKYDKTLIAKGLAGLATGALIYVVAYNKGKKSKKSK